MRVARELVVVEQTWRPGLPHETWEQRELRDGSRHRVFKRHYTPEELRDEISGAVALETGAFIAVRAGREAPDSDRR